MSIEGTVVNGAIVLDEGKQLPEGTRITVVLMPADPEDQPTLHSLVEMVGAFDDLPADFAAEHDHYLHGAPRQKSEKG
jgi:hypothetical protein